jgi:CHAD domain-containing protein
LQDEEKSMKKKARQTADDISLKDFEKKLIKESPDQLSKEIKNVFVQKRKQRLEELLTLPFYYDEGLHEVRKILKDLMYDYKYLENTIVAKLPSGINQVKAMRTLTTALGDFHDLCVALFLVSAVYIDRMENTDEIEIISDLKAQLQLRKEDMKTEIITRLQPLKQQVDKEKSLIQMYEVLN